MFRASEVPETFEFFERLSPLDQRLFVVELWEALSKIAIGGEGDRGALPLDLIDAWEATADLDSAPEVVAAIESPGRFQDLRIA